MSAYEAKKFTIICRNCEGDAVISKDTIGCGDPECCGDYEHVYLIACQSCGIREIIDI